MKKKTPEIKMAVDTFTPKTEENAKFHAVAVDIAERYLAMGYKNPRLVVVGNHTYGFRAYPVVDSEGFMVTYGDGSLTPEGAVSDYGIRMGSWGRGAVHTAHENTKKARDTVDRVRDVLLREDKAAAKEALRGGGPRWSFDMDKVSYGVCLNLATYKGPTAWCWHVTWKAHTAPCEGFEDGTVYKAQASIGTFFPRGVNYSLSAGHGLGYTDEHLANIRLVMGRMVAFAKGLATAIPDAPIGPSAFNLPLP